MGFGMHALAVFAMPVLQTPVNNSVVHRSLADRYWRKGQCRYSGSQPQWRKKASNRWHDCPANTVCEDGRRGCQCSAGYYASSDEESAYPTCTACTAGSISKVGDASCTLCPAGTAPDATASACKTCHAGTASNEGATACTTCSAGTASDEGAASCTAYTLRDFEFKARSQCYSDRLDLVGGNVGIVATVAPGLDGGVAIGAGDCETACRREIATGTDSESGCCFLNAFNGVCKFFDGTFEANSIVTLERTVHQYLAAPMDKIFGPVVTCTGSGSELQAATYKTCTGTEGVTVATLLLDNEGGKDVSKDGDCYEACVRQAQVEGEGAGCCRMNHFNGNCNWFAGEAIGTSTTHMYSAIGMSCS